MLLLEHLFMKICFVTKHCEPAKKTRKRRNTSWRSDQTSESAAQSGEARKAASTVIYHIKSGGGEINLPPCRLMAVELGPSADPNKATLQIVANKVCRD